MDETEIFLNTPNFDNFLDAAEEIAAHMAGIWSVVVVAYNAMNDIILTDRFNEINEILSLEFFYALYNYIYPGDHWNTKIDCVALKSWPWLSSFSDFILFKLLF